MYFVTHQLLFRMYHAGEQVTWLRAQLFQVQKNEILFYCHFMNFRVNFICKKDTRLERQLISGKMCFVPNASVNDPFFRETSVPSASSSRMCQSTSVPSALGTLVL